MVNDPIADFIIRLKNAGAVGKRELSVPHSKVKMAIAEKLVEVGYIKAAEKRGKKVKKAIDVTLSYTEEGAHKIQGVKRLSKPGRRSYRTVKDIHPVRFGHGSIILSTPKGIMTGKEARKEKVGGEALFEIW